MSQRRVSAYLWRRRVLVPVIVPDEEVRKKKEKVPKIVNSAPTMQLEKPIVTDVDYYNTDLSWTPASLPPNSTPTSFAYVSVEVTMVLCIRKTRYETLHESRLDAAF